MNDCWPAISWSIVDYFLTKKPAYYAIRRTLKPIAAGVQREHHDWSVVHARPAKTSAISVWVASNHQQEITVTVEIRYVSIKTGEDIRNKVVKKDVVLVPNGTTNVLTGQIDNTKDEPHVISVSVLKAGVCVSRDVDWPQPLKYLDFSDRGVDIQVTPGEYRITAKRPTKGLVFKELGGVSLGDNCIDIIPGEDVIVKATGSVVLLENLKYRYLGM
jgi:beta-mannosidase